MARRGLEPAWSVETASSIEYEEEEEEEEEEDDDDDTDTERSLAATPAQCSDRMVARVRDIRDGLSPLSPPVAEVSLQHRHVLAPGALADGDSITEGRRTLFAVSSRHRHTLRCISDRFGTLFRIVSLNGRWLHRRVAVM